MKVLPPARNGFFNGKANGKANGSGLYRFNGRFTNFDQADYILGYMSQFRQSNGEIEFRRHHYQAFYGGDTWRVSPRLIAMRTI